MSRYDELIRRAGTILKPYPINRDLYEFVEDRDRVFHGMHLPGADGPVEIQGIALSLEKEFKAYRRNENSQQATFMNRDGYYGALNAYKQVRVPGQPDPDALSKLFVITTEPSDVLEMIFCPYLPPSDRDRGRYVHPKIKDPEILARLTYPAQMDAITRYYDSQNLIQAVVEHAGFKCGPLGIHGHFSFIGQNGLPVTNLHPEFTRLLQASMSATLQALRPLIDSAEHLTAKHPPLDTPEKPSRQAYLNQVGGTENHEGRTRYYLAQRGPGHHEQRRGFPTEHGLTLDRVLLLNAALSAGANVAAAAWQEREQGRSELYNKVMAAGQDAWDHPQGYGQSMLNLIQQMGAPDSILRCEAGLGAALTDSLVAVATDMHAGVLAKEAAMQDVTTALERTPDIELHHVNGGQNDVMLSLPTISSQGHSHRTNGHSGAARKFRGPPPR